MPNLSNKILSDPINKWVFSSAKDEIYLVGGYLRDILLRDTSKDVDFVSKDDFEGLARRTAKRFNGTFIILKKNQACRIVLKDKRVIDITPLIGSIEDDLARRDFTINALAWSPDKGIVDPFGGREDIKKKQIKAIKPSNFDDDPLRVLRAYRMASEKGFDIDQETKKYLKQCAGGLSRVAPERITEELFKIIKMKDADNSLRKAFDNMVLEKIITIDEEQLKENLKLMRRYSIFIHKTDAMKAKRMRKFRSKEVSQGLTIDGLIKLAILLIGENDAKSSRTSRAIQKGVKDIHKALELSKGKMTDKRLYNIFKAAGEYVLEAAILLSVIKKESENIIKRANDLIKIGNRILLSGCDIQGLLNINEGVKIGLILESLEEERFIKGLKTKAEAKAWIISNFT